LIIAVDGSGSVRESGFKILKGFVTTLLKRYETEYFGDRTVKLGLVLFGNGVIMPDGKTVSPAINAQKLTFDKDKVKGAVEGLPFKKGFTNMAQAFAMAEDMFTKGSRSRAQQSVMLITDGKPSFSFMTNEMAEQLDDKAIMRYFVIVSETPMNDDSMKNIKRWASQPWETNLIHVGGLAMLDADVELFAEKAITKFCPLAYSPKTAAYEIAIYGFQHVKDGGFCGVKDKKNNLLSKTVDNAEQCAALASGAGKHSFMLGIWFRKGYCIGGTMEVTEAQYREWGTPAGKADPKCTDGDGWKSSMIFDFYAMEPAVMKD